VLAAALAFATPSRAQFAQLAPQPITRAEASDYRATSTYAEVVTFLDELAQRSAFARRIDLGQSVEERTLPALVLSNPAVATPDQAQALARSSGKMIVFLLGNIHAGEVDGKDALLILAREIALAPDPELLKNLIIVIAPIYNADGNERFGKDNRPGQVGPEDGMGVRENARGLDLNRDFIKAEAPETRALLRALRTWDPALFIDTHTTDGSFHRYLITYAGPKVPAGNSTVLTYVRDTMLPHISAQMKDQFGHDSYFYGNFDDAKSKWETFPAQPRYSTSYVGLRNRIGILSESYAYAPFKQRIQGSRDFVQSCLEYAAANRDAIRQMLQQADRAADSAGRDPKEDDLIALRTEARPREGKVTILGFEERMEDRAGHQQRISTGVPRDYEVEMWDQFTPTLSRPRAFAYLVDASETDVIENLQRHGVAVEELREDIELDVEVYRVTASSAAAAPFQGHSLLTIDVEPRAESRRFPAGTRLIRTAQPLGTLASFLLEPESEDGLFTWGYFGESFTIGADAPVVRLRRPTPVLSTRIRALDEDRTTGKRVTFDTPYLDNSRGVGGEWLPDGSAWREAKSDGNRLRMYRVDALSGRNEVAQDNTPISTALQSISMLPSDWARQATGGVWFNADAARTGAIFEFENDLYYARFDGTAARRLTSSPQREEFPTFSPDGRWVAFVKNYDLFVVDVESATERRLTTDGSETLRNGYADWVYFEELYGRNWKVFWWSPDSRRIAFLQTDNSMVPRFTIVNDQEFKQNVEVTAYPKPGEPNPQVRLGIVTALGGTPVFADLSSYSPADMLVSGVGWWPDSSAAYAYVQNRIQTWLDVCRIGAGDGSLTRVLRDQTEAWVESPGELRFLKDGSFLIASERTGYQRLYRYKPDGSLVGPVEMSASHDDWEMRGVSLVDEASGWIYFSANLDDPIASNFYRVKLDGGPVQRLTSEPGSHSVSVDPTGKWFIDTWSSRTQPTRCMLRNAADGAVLRVLDSNPVYALDDYVLPELEAVQIPMADDFLVEAEIIKPADFDPARKYPVWFSTYGGPHAPTVSNSWGGGRTWDRALANEGMIVFHADPRSASAKGARSAWACYRQMGVSELADIEQAIAWLVSQGYVDARRIGISGHSYGGFMTAFAMTHSKTFAYGVAGAPPTDWRLYDSIYTERYMDTPANNPAGYDATSVIKAAGQLHGNLLLIHGAIDDNVHAQNSIAFSRALQRAGKDFEMMLYPGYRHGIWGGHYSSLTMDFMKRILVEPPPEPSR